MVRVHWQLLAQERIGLELAYDGSARVRDGNIILLHRHVKLIDGASGAGWHRIHACMRSKV